MNSATSDSTTITERNSSIVSSSFTPPKFIPQSISYDHVIDSTSNVAVSKPETNDIVNTTPLKTVNSATIPPPYMNMAAVAAAFLQRGFNPPHLNAPPQASYPGVHPQSQVHSFFPPPPSGHGFGPELSNLVSTSTPKAPFASPLSAPLHSQRISRSSPVGTSDKSIMDDSGIGGMMSPPLSTPISASSNIKNDSGCSSSGSGQLKRKHSINGSQPNTTSTNIGSGNSNGSTTPTSTMTRTHQYKKVRLI